MSLKHHILYVRSIEKVVSQYRHKLKKFRKSWDEGLKSLSKSPDVEDPQELLDSALDEKMAQINRAIEQSEKYSQHAIELHLKRKSLLESILRRDIRKEILRKNKEHQRSKSIQQRMEEYEAKRERAREVEKEYSKKLKEDEKAMTERFKKIDKRIEETEQERLKHQVLKEKLSKERFEGILQNKEKEYEVTWTYIHGSLLIYTSNLLENYSKNSREL